MGVSLFYLLALLPVAAGAILWCRSREVVWQEWLIGAAVAFATAAFFHVASVKGMTHDVETWSGQITEATHYPRWVEKYTTTEHHSSGTGANRRTWTTTKTHYRTHPEHWMASTSIDCEYLINNSFFAEIVTNFGGEIVTSRPFKGGFNSGDRNVYTVYNQTGYVYPVTGIRSFENRVKVAPSLFSYAKVPDQAPVFPWPSNPDWRASERLVGTAESLYDQREFDLLNSRLGPAKKVNVIMVGWPAGSTQLGHWQEAAWIGGRKNDLVLCFGGASANSPATWAYVFGWTEKAICKRNLETLLLARPAGNLLLAAIEQEIRANYEIKDWSKFDYLTVEPPGWAYGLFFLVLAGSQTGLYVFFHRNDFGKNRYAYSYRYRRG